ncbi:MULTISPECIES: sigma-54 dependent transcriptional regulator [Stenotrophomonas maltophilia group]|uniref:sigma-54 dependent transcriptional regulator n=1 Tax=Stenotrophomonas maltophilia group TaxID=995085 RepID=UPI0018D35321|nr:sigma-54 dependent transcriptional regulator [Stenotrophomonas maltophilia]MBH1744557.1 sigma-54-dependent Fis family transcriptional regulator [Stenotrophomonas maltophilia]MBH1863726.1 sigma-54-dependent Fis family transcriptional regulator [Stenotrophomonas maltophilia]
MAAVPEASTSRCVLWFGEPLAGERSALAAAGWYVRSIHPDPGMAIGLRGRDRLLAVVDLRHMDGPALQLLMPWIEQHQHLPWLAVLPPGAGATPTAWLPLLRFCLARFTLPFGLQDLVSAMRQQFDADEPSADGACNGQGPRALIGESPALHAVRTVLHKFAPVELPVLVTGETGTGKELAAHALHALSGRAGRPFIAVNCGAIPANLVQSELFGHERGSFTGADKRQIGVFETAQGGTVFLDEVGDLPAEAQTSLLRVLQEGTFERVGSSQPLRADVRVLAATHVELEHAVAHGRFRSDLYYRLNVLRLLMPPLRERGADVQLLGEHFLRCFRLRHTVRARGFSAAAIQAMRRFDWPGNVRELLNRVQRAAIMAEGELISERDLELGAPVPAPPGAMLHDARGQAERDVLLQTLRQTGYNVSECARRMQISRVTVYRLCRKHRLELPAQR